MGNLKAGTPSKPIVVIPQRAKPVHCTWCQEVYSSVKTLYKHISCSSSCRPFFCQCCGSKFASIRRLAEHSKVHQKFPKKTYVCRSCDHHFVTTGNSHVLPGDENERFQVPSETPMEVDDDQRARRVFEVLDSEDEEESLSTVICMRCADRYRFSCPFCELTFPDIPSMTAHCVMHKGYFLYEYACDACERVFASLPALEEHLSQHEERSVFLCTVCGEKFNRIEDRESHRENHVSCRNMGALMLKTTNQNYIVKKKYQVDSTRPPQLINDYTKRNYPCNSNAAVKPQSNSKHPTVVPPTSSSEVAINTVQPETERGKDIPVPTSNMDNEKNRADEVLETHALDDPKIQTSETIVEEYMNDRLKRRRKKKKNKAMAAATAAAETSMDVDKPPGISDPIDKSMPCPFCSKVLSSSHALAQHCQVHEDYIYHVTVCNLCGHKATSVKTLSLHMSLHEKKTVNLCCICGIDCGKREALNKHINEDHNDKAEVHRSLSKKTNPLFANQSQESHKSAATVSEGFPAASGGHGVANVSSSGVSGLPLGPHNERPAGPGPHGNFPGPRHERPAGPGTHGNFPGPRHERPAAPGTHGNFPGPRHERPAAPGTHGNFPGPRHERPAAPGTHGNFPGPRHERPAASGTHGNFPGPRHERPAAPGTHGNFPGPSNVAAVAPSSSPYGNFSDTGSGGTKPLDSHGPRPRGAGASGSRSNSWFAASCPEDVTSSGSNPERFRTDTGGNTLPSSGPPGRFTGPRHEKAAVTKSQASEFMTILVPGGSGGAAPSRVTLPVGSVGNVASTSSGGVPAPFHICLLCNSTFPEKREYVFHMRLIHKRPFICRYCDKSFSLIDGLAVHCHEHPQFPLRGFRCNTCNIRFVSLRSLEEHLSGHEGKRIFICCLCGEIFDTSSEREIHENSHGTDDLPEPPISNASKKVLPQVSGERQMNPLNTRDASAVGNKVQNLSTVKTRPQQVIEDIDDPGDNEETAPGTSVQNTPAVVIPRSKKVPLTRQCKYCDLWFPQNIGRKQHMRTVHLLWRCTKCGAMLDKKEKLACHMRKKHSKKYTTLNLYCSTCKQFRKSLEELERCLSGHAGTRVFICSICAMRLYSDQERDVHEEGHKTIIP